MTVTLPPEALRIPGLTALLERECLYRTARELEPIGQIVDLGCWLGSLTAALASGVRDNPRLATAPPSIYAYDMFIWQPYMDAHLPHLRDVGIDPPAHGDSFLPLFEAGTTPWQSLIRVRVGNAAVLGWADGPIALLSIDLMKNVRTAQGIVREFYPSLVPGKSLVFQQDFTHYYHTWIHLLQWRMRDHFTVVEAIPWSAGVLFKYETAIPRADYDFILDFDRATDDEWAEAFAFARSIVSKNYQEPIFAAEIMRLVHERRFAEARALAADYETQGILGPQFEIMKASPLWKQALETQ